MLPFSIDQELHLPAGDFVFWLWLAAAIRDYSYSRYDMHTRHC